MADSFTKLLLHANGVDGSKEIQDSGATGHIVSIPAGTTGTLSLAQAKFGICSLLLDGNSDYLTVPDHADWDLTKDTTNYTIDFWVKHTDHAGSECYITQYEDANNYWRLFHTHGNGIGFIMDNGGVRKIDCTYGTEIADTNWHHIALIKTSTTYSIYLDGTRVVTVTDADTDTFAGLLYIGTEISSSYFDGYIDELMISQDNRLGAASSATCTVPTAARTSDANTKLLLHMESLDVSSTTAPKIPTFVGTAQLDTAQKKFGSASLLLDGDFDYVTIPDSADWDFGTGDFTIDCWVRMNGIGAAQIIVEHYESSAHGDEWRVQLQASNKIQFYSEVSAGMRADFVTDNAVITATNTWYHVAIVRSGSTPYIFINGTSVPITINTALGDISNITGNLNIGWRGSDDYYFNGWIDELRISKGIARWTANFTPPTSEYGTWKGRAMLI